METWVRVRCTYTETELARDKLQRPLLTGIYISEASQLPFNATDDVSASCFQAVMSMRDGWCLNMQGKRHELDRELTGCSSCGVQHIYHNRHAPSAECYQIRETYVYLEMKETWEIRKKWRMRSTGSCAWPPNVDDETDMLVTETWARSIIHSWFCLFLKTCCPCQHQVMKFDHWNIQVAHLYIMQYQTYNIILRIEKHIIFWDISTTI